MTLIAVLIREGSGERTDLHIRQNRFKHSKQQQADTTKNVSLIMENQKHYH